MAEQSVYVNVFQNDVSGFCQMIHFETCSNVSGRTHEVRISICTLGFCRESLSGKIALWLKKLNSTCTVGTNNTPVSVIDYLTKSFVPIVLRVKTQAKFQNILNALFYNHPDYHRATVIYSITNFLNIQHDPQRSCILLFKNLTISLTPPPNQSLLKRR